MPRPILAPLFLGLAFCLTAPFARAQGTDADAATSGQDKKKEQQEQQGQDQSPQEGTQAPGAATGRPGPPTQPQPGASTRPGTTNPAAQPRPNPAQNPPAQNPAAAGQNGATGRPPTQNNGRPAASTQQPGTQRPVGGVQGEIPKIQESGEYYVLTLDEQGEGIDLEWLTKMCQIATGKNFTYDDTIAESLRKAKVRMFGDKRVPKVEFYEFYQILMFINGFTITKVGPEHLAVYLIQPLGPQAGGKSPPLKDDAIYILPNELDRYADQVATQIMTVLHLPNTDVRTLGNSLRGLAGNDQSGTIMPVANTQSVVLRGFAPQVVAIARILKLVDDEAAKDIAVQPLFEVIPLEFAAAEDLSDILEQMLEAKKRESQLQRQANPQGATGQIQTGGGETKVLTYPRTNSLLVMALPEDMIAIKELIARLDVDVPDPDRTYHVYALEHVQAEDLSDVLEEFIEGAARVQQNGAAGGAAARPGNQAPSTPGLSSRDNEVIVVPDATTNSLLIAASRRRYEEVLELIHRLDKRQEQVLIETALIELSGQESLNLGVELGGADLPGDGLGSFGITSFGLSDFSDTDGDGVFDQRIPNKAPGVTAGILDADDFQLPVLIQAIQTRDDSNVLNIPSVLVNNNGSATVKTLDEQPTTTRTFPGSTGQSQETFNDYQEAGITMQISPSISASGYLRLQVSLEVSNFTGSFSGPIPPPRVTRTIDTSVNVPDGDTMVIGGIIVDNKGHSRDSVPWLGDIPLLGALFRVDSDSQNRTTLYFFVTPHILRDQNFADLGEISYKVKLNASEKIGADRVQMIDPTFGKPTKAIDMRGFDVPLYRRPAHGEVEPSMIGKEPSQAAPQPTEGEGTTGGEEPPEKEGER
jgi:general secretion pathway protein D